MSNMPIQKHSNNGDRRGSKSLSTHLPYIDDLFNRFTSSWPLSRRNFADLESTELSLNPKVDVVEDNKSYRLTAELPGLDLKDISLDLSDDILTLSGEKKTEKEEGKDGDYHLMERSYGYFKRSFALPPSVEEDKIKADFKKGILSVVMPKSEKAQQHQRKISIKE
jgi:HSP20 family protein